MPGLTGSSLISDTDNNRQVDPKIGKRLTPRSSIRWSLRTSTCLQTMSWDDAEQRWRTTNLLTFSIWRWLAMNRHLEASRCSCRKMRSSHVKDRFQIYWGSRLSESDRQVRKVLVPHSAQQSKSCCFQETGQQSSLCQIWKHLSAKNICLSSIICSTHEVTNTTNMSHCLA